ncbi:hypothetical protein WS83_20270 [Burkholderia sp. MSMB2042]|nr:hypothetical protein WS78_11780 [Burkholderia savannae]KVG37565.1 hypothetical protein WS77_02010 [Burkholderia sp. MSMB0265]KVG88306.1 hypothetical protein WS81_25215 [Burkholderia sp. MSMB2040]KVG93857.1 hypothetical protein WS82_08710 [Burkholderia sp. MSMB2041]KVH01109.1 hypothetical protein WS83_20270 [Burkholderia sp. MSMB2042]
MEATKNAIELPELNEGEHYAGILIGKDGAPSHHVILLAGDAEDLTWKAAKEWAASIGGDLPSRREQSLLFANLGEQFKRDWYWSAEQHSSNSGWAWYQLFHYGGQDCYGQFYEFRARAVRRLIIQ